MKLKQGKYKGCNIKYENITIEECLNFYNKYNISCNCDADNKEIYFIQEQSEGEILWMN